MMNEDEVVKLDLVSTVVKNIHGPSCKLLDYEVEKGTASVQGFFSNILRVTARVMIGSSENAISTKYVVKNFPELPAQQYRANLFGFFDQEIGFFDDCAPILWKLCPDLPAVKCFYTNLEEKFICMEDLTEIGYVAIVQSMRDLKNDILTMDHIELVMKTLAKFHSTSVGINWLEKFPRMFQEDTMYETKGGELLKNRFKQLVELNILPIAKMHFKDNESLLKSVEWMASEDCFQKLTSLAKSDPNEVNVLCHGDSWANNMMFKVDQETGKPIDIKLIDFQICRYAPLSRDALYFMYLCTSFGFRQKYEKAILQQYLAYFNANCLRLGKDLCLKWDEFYAEYNKSRFYGIIIAVLMRPMMFVKGLYPSGDDKEITEENILNQRRHRTESQAAIEEFQSNDGYKKEMINIIEEIHAAYQTLFCSINI